MKFTQSINKVLWLLYFVLLKRKILLKFWKVNSNYPSTHPLSAAYLGSGRGGSWLSRVVQTYLSPAVFSSSSWGIPRPDEIYNCSRVLWVCPAVSYHGSHPEGILIRCLDHLNWLLLISRSSSSTPRFLWLTNIGRLHSQSHSFGHYLKLMVMPAVLQMLHRLHCACRSCAPFYPHLWTGPWDT